MTDPVFAEKTMGDGVAIVPVGGPLAAPVDGTLSALFPTGHAFGVEAGDLSVMVHGGIDTVDLEGGVIYFFGSLSAWVHSTSKWRGSVLRVETYEFIYPVVKYNSQILWNRVRCLLCSSWW